MNRRYSILLIVLLLSSVTYGQFIGRDNLSKSLFYMQKEQLDSAKKYIDLAMVDEQLNKAVKTWYYKGFIYKEIYKKRDKSNKISPYRTTAVNTLQKVLKMDSTKEFTESSTKMLRYLSSTLYNDAARALNPKDYEIAIKNYNNYKKIVSLIDPKTDLNAQDVKFKLALASMLNKPVESGQILDSVTIQQITTLYLEVLSLDPNNPAANYNLAILYYNEAAEIINNMDYDMDLEKLNEVQDYCIEIFLKGLPYMLKAYQLNYKREQTLLGLSNIYYGLNDMEKSEHYKKELEELKSQENKQKDLEKE